MSITARGANGTSEIAELGSSAEAHPVRDLRPWLLSLELGIADGRLSLLSLNSCQRRAMRDIS